MVLWEYKSAFPKRTGNKPPSLSSLSVFSAVWCQLAHLVCIKKKRTKTLGLNDGIYSCPDQRIALQPLEVSLTRAEVQQHGGFQHLGQDQHYEYCAA
jgi:hypothetical protein